LSWPLTLAAFWVLAAMVGWITWANGPLIGLLVLAAGASVLRWPVIYLGRWLRRPRVR
jgi:NhaP-type Na+/H+ or K+/H+ antiporter